MLIFSLFFGATSTTSTDIRKSNKVSIDMGLKKNDQSLKLLELFPLKMYFVITLLLLLPAFYHAQSCTPTGRCNGPIRIRKEVREMKADGDLDSFINAFKTLATNGVLANYVNLHNSQSMNRNQVIHNNPMFLPFHRWLLWSFENDLIAHGAKYIPYWYSPVDSSNVLNSPILQSDYFGSNSKNDGTIIDGPFRQGSFLNSFGRPLLRGIGTDFRNPPALFYQQLIDNVVIRSGGNFRAFNEFCL